MRRCTARRAGWNPGAGDDVLLGGVSADADADRFLLVPPPAGRGAPGGGVNGDGRPLDKANTSIPLLSDCFVGGVLAVGSIGSALPSFL